MSDVARAFGKSGGAVFGLCLVVMVAIAAVVAPALAPHDPDAIDTPRRLARAFTHGHWLGTDGTGLINYPDLVAYTLGSRTRS